MDILGPIIVVGASSTVGSTVSRQLSGMLGSDKIYGTYYKGNAAPGGNIFFADIERPETLDNLFNSLHPSHIINFAALADVFTCEADPRRAEALNVAGAKNVALACARHGARMIQISTDYIFDGTQGPYDESAKPNPINVYGSTKFRGEQECLSVLGSGLVIVRLSHVYNRADESVNTGMLSLAADDTRKLEVPSNIITTPTRADSIAPFLIDIMRSGDTGIFHLSDGILMSWYELSLVMAERYGIIKERIIPVHADEWRRQGNVSVRWPLHGGIRSSRKITISL